MTFKGAKGLFQLFGWAFKIPENEDKQHSLLTVLVYVKNNLTEWIRWYPCSKFYIELVFLFIFTKWAKSYRWHIMEGILVYRINLVVHTMYIHTIQICRYREKRHVPCVISRRSENMAFISNIVVFANTCKCGI